MAVIGDNIRWRAGETINLTSNVEIAFGATLTVEPGAIINGNGYSIMAEGTLSAIGTTEKPIDFNNVGFLLGLSTSKAGTIAISHSTLDGGSFLPATGNGSYGRFNVTDSVLTGVSGFYIWYPYSGSSFERNLFVESAGLSVGTSNEFLIKNNTFVQQSGAAVTAWANYGNNLRVEENSFLSTDRIALALQQNYTSASMNASNNYFGTTDVDTINAMIRDARDSITYNAIISPSALMTPAAAAPKYTLSYTPVPLAEKPLALIISSTTVWRAGETINLTSNVEIAFGATLTVEPGAIINGNGYSIMAEGTLSAVGTTEKPIDFNNVGFLLGLSTSKAGTIAISHSTLDGGSFLPATGNGGYGKFNVTDSVLTNVSGFYIWYPYSGSSFERNLFVESAGLSVGTSNEFLIKNNTFVQQSGAAVTAWANYGNNLRVEENSFLSTDRIALALQQNYTSASMNASNNYFGTTDVDTINAMIRDARDSITYNAIINPSALTTPAAAAPKYITVFISDASMVEGASGNKSLTYTVTLSEAASSTVTFTVRTGGGTATAGSDYASVDRTVAIAAGSTSVTVDVLVAGDTKVETDETVILTLSQITGAVLANRATSVTATGIIRNDDLPILTLSGGTVTEGDSGSRSLTYTVSLSDPAPATVTFMARTGGGTATAGADYASVDHSVTIAAGSTTATINVPVIGDTKVEADETVILTLSQIVGATLANNASSVTATGIIRNDDLPILTLSGGTVTEGDSGSKSLTYTVTLSDPAAATVTFMARTGGGTATAGADYASVDHSVTIAAGSTTATINVPVIGDTKVEADETVILTLSQIVGATLANNASNVTATGTIRNDDLPTLTLSNPSVTEGSGGTKSLSYTVTLSDPAPAAVTFAVKTTDGTATAGTDYTSIDRTVTIAAGSTTAAIEVPILGDTKVETDETVILTLSQIAGATLANGTTSITATGTIINDDAAAGLALSYRALNPDLSAVFGSDYEALIRHYIQYGRAEGRSVAGFDPEAYAALNPDLYQAFGLDTDALLSHYLSNGRLEQRKADGFDALAYAARNPDLFAAFGTDRGALVDHYVRYGAAEKRSGTGFDVEAYAALNSDLFTAFGLDEKSLLSHFVNFGAAEGRSAAGFDAEIYAALNPDLFAVFGLNHTALIEHYVKYGKAEGRVASFPAPAAAPMALSMEGLPGLLPGGDTDGIG